MRLRFNITAIWIQEYHTHQLQEVNVCGGIMQNTITIVLIRRSGKFLFKKSLTVTMKCGGAPTC